MTDIIPINQQIERSRELDRLRCERGLTSAEAAEADRLAARAYMRAWRAVQRDIEISLLRRQV